MQFSSFWLCIPPQWTWKETLNICLKCRLSALNLWYLHTNRVNSVGNSLYVVSAFWGTIGSLAIPWPGVCIPSLFHLKEADKRSRINFKCGNCIWNLFLSTVNMKSKRAVNISEAKTLGVAKSTVRDILKKKECTGELSNTKRPRGPWKTTVVDERRMFFSGEVKSLHNRWPDQEHSPGDRHTVSKSTTKRRLCQSKYRGFITRCKLLVSLKTGRSD